MQYPPQEIIKNLINLYDKKQLYAVVQQAKTHTKQYPQASILWNILGAANTGLGQISQASKAFLKVTQLNPKYAPAHSNLANMLRELGQLNAAEASYIKAIMLKPDSAEAHSNLGVTLQELGRLNEAEASFRRAVSLKPNFAEAHNNLGNTLKELGRLDEAEASFNQVIAMEPDKFASVYDELGVILQIKGDFEKAEVCYKKCMSIEPNKMTKTLSRGDILFKEGFFEQALSYFENYDNVISRAQILESLYALGKLDEIYTRIAATSDLDGENLRVAAIAAFLTEREKKKTANNFCNNPMDFLHFSNISFYTKKSDSFITSVIDELKNIKTKWELNTTQNGFQADIDIFKNPLKTISVLKEFIFNELDKYYSKFKNESCSYIQKWPSKKNIKGWHVILKQQGCQTAHIHPNGWLSGVIYLMVVPPLKKNEGAIEFSLNGPNYSDVITSKKIYQPRLGDMVFFPSSLHHRTLPFSTNMDRICISFDLLPVISKL